jgi:hypothetical protein
VNQTAEGAFVETEATGAVKPSEAGTADRTDTLFVQWIGVYERRVTAGAEVFGFELNG